jgi:hypothetical protein
MPQLLTLLHFSKFKAFPVNVLFDWAMITAWFRWMAVILQYKFLISFASTDSCFAAWASMNCRFSTSRIWRSLSKIFFVVFCLVVFWFEGDEGGLDVGVETGFGGLTGNLGVVEVGLPVEDDAKFGQFLSHYLRLRFFCRSFHAGMVSNGMGFSSAREC